MQKPHINLKEIIYEITDNCNQNCSYCGSKDDINKTPIDSDNIKTIIDQIAQYPPDIINVSGGNPLLISLNDHEYLINKLKSVNVKCHIIINPFNRKNDIETDTKLSMYDSIGVSVNSKEELIEVLSWNDLLKCTIISNFNINNIFLFNEIQDFVINQGLYWQIQYTMFKDKNPSEIYSSQAAINYLHQLIKNSNANIIAGDNINPNISCSAGLNSLGILANGDVIPCLSMKAWTDIKPLTFGNLLRNSNQDSLDNIWIKKFAQFRCEEFSCCKDHCNINLVPCPDITPITYPETSKFHQVMVYGVVPWNTI